jgi:hypothetical protein
VSTAGYVKLLLPPRQSRGNSHWGLEPISKSPEEDNEAGALDKAQGSCGRGIVG